MRLELYLGRHPNHHLIGGVAHGRVAGIICGQAAKKIQKSAGKSRIPDECLICLECAAQVWDIAGRPEQARLQIEPGQRNDSGAERVTADEEADQSFRAVGPGDKHTPEDHSRAGSKNLHQDK